MIKLSKRLQRIADYVSANRRVADIGSDHALLPTFLLQSGKCRSAIAGELNAGPMQAARKQAADAGLTRSLEVRQGNGLAVLQPGEVDTVTIAGMGGSLMSEILETGRAAGKLQGVTELVLQPNVGEDAVRSWLRGNGWYLADESILEEDGKIYEVLHAVAVAPEEALKRNEELYNGSFLGLDWNEELLDAVLLRMGPHLLRRGGAVLTAKWNMELKKLARIREQLAESELAESALRREQFRKEMTLIEEVLHCLPTVKL